MGTKSKRGVHVTRRCRKNGRRYVQMVCRVASFQIAAALAQGFNTRDDSHRYAFSWRTTSEKSPDYWCDMCEHFDVEAFFRKLDGVPEPVSAFR